MTDVPARVSVVLVHGIGSQKPGQTLREVADRLIAFWTGKQPDLSVTHSETILRGESPTSEMQVGTAEGSQIIVRFLEANWAGAFYPPPSVKVLTWLARVVPLTLATRGTEIIETAFNRWVRHPLHWWRILAAACVVVLGFPVLMLTLLLVGVSAILRPLIPFTAVKAALATFEEVVSQILGDSYLYLMSPSDAAAIATVVRRTLATASADSDAVVVVAHSQGAQIAVDVLSTSEVSVAHLLTLGSGIGQLQWLRTTLKTDPLDFVIAGAVWAWVLGAPAAVALAAWNLQEGASPAFEALFGLANPVYWVPVSIIPLVHWLRRRGRNATLEASEFVLPTVSHWTDLNATADPVSGVAVLSFANEQVRERVVVNSNNAFTDHTSYFANGDEVLSVLADAVVHAARSVLASRLVDDDGLVPVLPEQLTGFLTMTPTAASVQDRHRAGRWRVGNRWAIVAATAVVLHAVLSHRAPLSNLLWEQVADIAARVRVHVSLNQPAVMGVPVGTLGLLGLVLLGVAAMAFPMTLLCRRWLTSVYRVADSVGDGDDVFTPVGMLGAQFFCVAAAIFAASRIEWWGSVDIWPWMYFWAGLPLIGMLLVGLAIAKRRVPIPDGALFTPFWWVAGATLLIGSRSANVDTAPSWMWLGLPVGYPVGCYAAGLIAPWAHARRMAEPELAGSPGIAHVTGAIALIVAQVAFLVALPSLASAVVETLFVLVVIMTPAYAALVAYEAKATHPRTFHALWLVSLTVALGTIWRVFNS